jgi:ribonuclease D
MNLITTTADLAAACARLATHPFVTIDTEFLRDSTYYPKLCLLQMASPDEGLLVDPLAPELDLAPFFALMADQNVMKVFHAARQDLEIVWNLGRMLPTPLFDTQIAAMVCGYGDSVGYEQLANDLAKAGSTSPRASQTGRAARSARRNWSMPCRT